MSAAARAEARGGRSKAGLGEMRGEEENSLAGSKGELLC